MASASRGVRAAERRPALDRLLADAKRRRLDVVVCWRLDRLGRNLKHLISLLDDLQVLGQAFVSLAEGIDRRRRPASPRRTASCAAYVGVWLCGAVRTVHI
jgi:DNA invertase Pin-like site-specific DNA recombinase